RACRSRRSVSVTARTPASSQRGSWRSRIPIFANGSSLAGWPRPRRSRPTRRTRASDRSARIGAFRRRTYTPGTMDDERWERGMPVLERQPARVPILPPSLQGLPPRSVPETAPTPLQKHYVLLSVPVLILGTIAITALELGTPLGSPLIKLCALIAAPLFVVTTADALVRIWRSAWA